jgi:methyl-accepting chemotaxis protein
MEHKKKWLSMMKALLLIALVPTLLSAIVVAVVGIKSMVSALQDDVYHELIVAADGLSEYYTAEIIESEDGMPTYSHDYVDSQRENDIHLTLLMGDVRYLTSIEDPSNPTGRNEGTTASAEIWSTVSKGNQYTASGVEVNGEDYYVAYVPLYDGDNNVVGMAFAGKEEALVNESVNSCARSLAFVAIIVVVCCAIVVVIVARNIKEPLVIIDRNLELLSNGELKPWKTATSSVREIDSIIQSRKKLSAALTDIVSRVQNVSNELLKDGNDLQSVASNTSTNAEDISHAVEEMSKGAISMATDIEHATDKVVDMGSKIEGIVGGIADLDNVAEGMDAAGQKAMDIITALDHSNEKTVEAIQVVAENVEATDRSVSEISTAVNVITAIADQTNLLALNASIEAARAGEAGRGFAVVANEISSLADQSSDSAKQIESILAMLVADSRRSIEKMEEVQKHLQEQQENLRHTQEEFSNVSEGIQNTKNQSSMVDGQARDCDESRSSVIDIISNLSAVSEQNAASTEETTASIEELTSAINVLAQQATEVQKQSQVLEDAMKFFKM